jgi:hypothetical protein
MVNFCCLVDLIDGLAPSLAILIHNYLLTVRSVMLSALVLERSAGAKHLWFTPIKTLRSFDEFILER